MDLKGGRIKMKKFLIVSLCLVMLVGIFGMPKAQQAKLVIWADDTRTPIFREIGEVYTEATGIPVEVVEMRLDQIRDQAVIANPAGEGPDLMIAQHDWTGRLAAGGIIAELKLPENVLAQFDPVTLEAFSYGGKLYGIPYAREGVALLYNKDLVPSPPTTWDELIKIARELTDPTVPQYGFIVEYHPYNFFPIIAALEGYIFGKTPEGGLNFCDIGLDNVGSVLGAELIDWLLEEGLLPYGIQWETMTGLLTEGRAGMVITGPWTIPIARAAGINVDVALIPPIAGQPARPFVSVPGVMVNAYSPNKAIIQDFLLNHFITKDTMLIMYQYDPRIPAYLPAYEEIAGELAYPAFAKSLANGVPMPNVPEMGTVWSFWVDAWELIGKQELEPWEALHQAAELLRETLGCK
jgi:maltose-binding protein MalE